MDNALVQNVKKDMELLDAVHLGSEVEGMEVKDDGTIVYSHPIDDTLTSYITVSESVEGDIVVTILEGDLYNELTFTTDGRMLLDGKELASKKETVQESASQDASVMRAGPISRCYAITLTENSSGTDVVTPTGFTRGSTSTNTYVSMGDYLKNMTVLALKAWLLQEYLESIVDIIIGIPQATLSSVLDVALTSTEVATMKNANPESKNVNFKCTLYTKNGNNTLYAEYIYVFRFYGNADCVNVPAIASAKKITEST